MESSSFLDQVELGIGTWQWGDQWLWGFGGQYGAAVKSLEAKLETLTAEHNKQMEALSAGLIRRDKQTVLARAASQGKVVCLDASALDKLTVAELEAHVEKLQATVPTHSRTAGAVEPGGQGGAKSANGVLLEQYNAITDPVKRNEFYKTSGMEKIFGK